MRWLLNQLQARGSTQGLGTQRLDHKVTHLLGQLLEHVLRQVKTQKLKHSMTQVLGHVGWVGMSVAWQLIW